MAKRMGISVLESKTREFEEIKSAIRDFYKDAVDVPDRP